ncbi:MAG: glycosyltransferase, partial [Gemmatimonadota bacterium]|nr:glycosyltransferase [Gemmatimonadota bacterium]
MGSEGFGAAPLVSVITPCYNAEPFVGETIRSVLAQTHPAVEHVLVDDASTDGSWAVIKRYAAEHPERIRALRLEENRGGSHARNRGAELARGAFLMFLDADDLIAPDTLASLANAAGSHPAGIGICAWKRLRPREDGRWVTGPADVPLPPSDPDGALRAWLEVCSWVPPCAVLW